MSRMIGTVSMGVRAPIIREGDDLVQIVADCVMAAADGGELAPFVDYVAEVKLDKTSGRVYTEATVKTFVDGDTTHFYVPTSVSETGVLKARYLAVNTPESTGKIRSGAKKLLTLQKINYYQQLLFT